MYQDHNKLTEAAHIADELFSDLDYELERQCQSVRHAETRGILSREKALKAYKVTPGQYTLFLAKNTSKLLLPPTNDIFIEWSDNIITVHAISKTIENFAARQNPRNKSRLKHLSDVLNAMKHLSEDVEDPHPFVED